LNDPVDRVIVERGRMDAGFPGGVLVSLVVHLVLVGVAVAAPLLFPTKPRIVLAEGFAVPLPRGGGGVRNPEPPAPAAAPLPKVEAPAPAPEPVKVLKPPTKDEPKPSSKALPELDARKPRKNPEPPAPGPPGGREARATTPGAATGAGTASTTPGLALGPPGPGVQDGTDSGGDYYLAGVQQKIWMIWNQQIKAGFTQPVAVTFTILADGTLDPAVDITQTSGVTLLDLAAKRAVYSAQPFAPLPKSYGTNRKTIQAVFKPIS
jgi:outer membrane biosynthesis protein TonB